MVPRTAAVVVSLGLILAFAVRAQQEPPATPGPRGPDPERNADALRRAEEMLKQRQAALEQEEKAMRERVAQLEVEVKRARDELARFEERKQALERQRERILQAVRSGNIGPGFVGFGGGRGRSARTDATTEKLDEILRRLEALERRLDHIERGQPPARPGAGRRGSAEGAVLKTYPVPNGRAEALAELLLEFRGSKAVKISAVGSNKIAVYATPEDHGVIAREITELMEPGPAPPR